MTRFFAPVVACSVLLVLAVSPLAGVVVGGGWSSTAAAASSGVVFGGRDVPLAEALPRLVPDAERGRVVADPDVQDRPISWAAGRHWFETLRSAVQRAGLAMRRQEDGTWRIVAAAQARPADSSSRDDAARPVDPMPGMVSAGQSSGQVERSAATVSRGVVGGPWRAQRGQSLEDVLKDWAARAGWQVVYNTNIAYVIEASLMLDGSFEDVVRQLIDGIEARPAPRAVLYRGNRTVVVATGFEDLRP